MIVLDGVNIRLEEVEPKHFQDIIAWRNDPKLNEYLNQPFKLTLEMQERWYQDYLADETQTLFVLYNKVKSNYAGTYGITNYNSTKRQLVTGRLIVADNSLRGLLYEMEVVFSDYLYQRADTFYSHIMEANTKALRWNEAMGYRPNTGAAVFPELLEIRPEPMVESLRTREDYLKIRPKLARFIR